ncbi:PREDICTED: pectinesterase inhibitor-like [Ipomoea nil]|uniref:pectinesterase inhibitor-like n=1 Tax=Ipomoea nil TaxID=35883 RepID=UPI000901CD75|nr:PREDICTED: pectinesterase inhibitor-like [Ipomoea nil]
MAFPHKLSTFFFAVLVAVVAATTVTADLVDTVCGKTPQPALCTQTLRADPRSKDADLNALGLVAIDIATNEAKSGQALVQSLLNGATDPNLKEIYSSCVEHYTNSVNSLGKCPDLLRSRDFTRLNIQASAALDNPGNCDEEFSEGSAAEPPQVKDTSSKLQEFCNIVLVISSLSKGA